MQLFGQKEHLTKWIERAKAGDSRAQKSIYDSLGPKMFAVCMRYMGERETATDVFQDAFITLFNKLDTYSGEGSFEGWARKIFVNTALMSLRKKDVLKESEDIEEAFSLKDESVDAIASLRYKDLMRLVSELPSGYRTVFNMFVIEGYSHKEIAQTLGIEEVTSRSQLLRARVMLQEKIKKQK